MPISCLVDYVTVLRLHDTSVVGKLYQIIKNLTEKYRGEFLPIDSNVFYAWILHSARIISFMIISFYTQYTILHNNYKFLHTHVCKNGMHGM